jgi:N-methylhydantoinase B/oxoprolinase/acetone carboxylase alpha subunit
MSSATNVVDQVTLQVVNNYLVTTTREMGVAMRNTSYSPLFNEGLDFSCAVFDPQGEMLAQGDFCPSQLGAMKFVVEWTIAELGVETFRPGDVLFHNDPYRGGCHVPEYCVIKPVFFRDEPVGYASNIGHMTETGGKSPGSFPGDSTDVFQEGIRIPPVKIIEAGQDVPIVWNIIMANVRTPRVSYGDLKALIGALTIGERRIVELVEKYGLDEYLAITEAIKDYAERRMRAEIAEMPNGTYELEEYICDNDGLTAEPAKLRLRITIEGDQMTVDYTGSDPQRRGPINCTYGVTAGATYNALLHLTDESIPANEGAYRPVRIIAPSGTIVNVEYPGALVGGNSEVHPHIVMAIYRALSEALPERVSAYDGGTSAILTFGGIHPLTGDVFVNLLNDGCGWGGRATKDGNTCLCIPNGNCALQAIEVLETRYPIAHQALRIWENSAGAGKNRGGWGYIREMRIDCDEMTVSMFMERERIPPSGLFGGEDGPTSAILISQDGGKTFKTFSEAFGVACNAKFSGVVLGRGDIIREMIPGGGGYGPPLERDPERIEEDLRQGYITSDQAERAYGAVIAPDGIHVDREATLAERSSRGGST